MIDYNTNFNPPSPFSALKIEEGESLIALEVHVTPRETGGDLSRNSSMLSMPIRIKC